MECTKTHIWLHMDSVCGFSLPTDDTKQFRYIMFYGVHLFAKYFNNVDYWKYNKIVITYWDFLQNTYNIKKFSVYELTDELIYKLHELTDSP